ncbi:MAG: UbiD family decarboxylase [Chloroflexi bacterium]|nr:UbiD family decarboxylase [Chloroflexota bacterium]
MAFEDLREFIKTLAKTGDVVHIRQEVDWDLEAGAIGRRAYELQSPAVLFEKIKDYDGFRIFGGMLGTFRRVAIAMGLDPATPVKELYAEYERRIKQPIKPVITADGPCKQNKIIGDKVDLFSLPTPYIHDGDGGRYIGTWAFAVTQSPENGWTNWGMYRFMIHNKNHIVGWPRYSSHLGMVLHKQYVPQNKPMPIALVLGTDPLCNMVATDAIPIGADEVDFAGGLRQEPIELVKCETNDLLVPANAEIVIEGEIYPDRTAQEGPFAEYPGYRMEGAKSGVLWRVKAITYRNSPIFTMISLGVPPDDSSIAASLTAALAMKRRLLRHEIPITEVYVPPYGVTHIVVVGVKRGGNDVAKQIKDVLTARRADVNKIIVVDNDIDPFDFDQVIHAFATKCHPIRGIFCEEIEPPRGNALTPAYNAQERRAYRGAIALFDCTWPPELNKINEVPVKNSFDSMFPEELKKKVVANWKSFGFKEKK